MGNRTKRTHFLQRDAGFCSDFVLEGYSTVCTVINAAAKSRIDGGLFEEKRLGSSIWIACGTSCRLAAPSRTEDSNELEKRRKNLKEVGPTAFWHGTEIGCCSAAQLMLRKEAWGSSGQSILKEEFQLTKAHLNIRMLFNVIISVDHVSLNLTMVHSAKSASQS
ncbi:hypothetical protein C8R42DRAFT_643777 [Lentinula raphanica]|nr:hypothetical protein C8R42DRAFT_643777 [Lentinula raphanica]